LQPIPLGLSDQLGLPVQSGQGFPLRLLVLLGQGYLLGQGFLPPLMVLSDLSVLPGL
jgi:hypothetical protein